MPDQPPAYRLHKPSGQAVVRLNGHDFYLGKHDSPASHAEYDRLIAEWLANGRQINRAPAEGATTDITIAEVMLGYLKFADSYYQKNGEPTKEPAAIRQSLKPLRRLYAHTDATKFGPLGLKAVREEMVRSGLCRNEVNKRVGRVIRMFGWAVSNELLPVTIHQALKTVPGLRRGRSEARETAKVKPVPEAMIEAVRPFVTPQVWTMVGVQRLTGMRPGEVCIMRGCDLDMTGDVWTYVPNRHKTEHHGHSRTIFIGPKAQDVLKPWLRADPDEYLFQPREAVEAFHAARRDERKTPMTPSQSKRTRVRRPTRRARDHYAGTSYAHAIMDACDRAFPHPTITATRLKDLPFEEQAELKAWRKQHRWHPHRLRHNAGTYLRSLFGPDVARTVLGQKTLAATQIYAEADMEKAREAMGEAG